MQYLMLDKIDTGWIIVIILNDYIALQSWCLSGSLGIMIVRLIIFWV